MQLYKIPSTIFIALLNMQWDSDEFSIVIIIYNGNLYKMVR